MSSRLKEKFLLFRIRAKKDPEAFGVIYDTYVQQIYRFIYFKVPSAEQAEDLTSETFLKAWQYLKEKREVSHLQALLYKVARSVVIDYYRTTSSERETVSLEETVSNESTTFASEKFLRDTEVQFDTTAVLEKLRGLKEDYREVVIMKYLDELTTREIATVLGKSTSNVRVLLHRATKALTETFTHDQQRTEDNFSTDKK